MDLLDRCYQWSECFCYEICGEVKVFMPFYLEGLQVSNGEQVLLTIIAEIMAEIANYCSIQPIRNV